MLSRYTQPEGLWQRRWGFSKRPDFLNHRLLPAKVGSPTHHKHYQKKPPRPKRCHTRGKAWRSPGVPPYLPPLPPEPSPSYSFISSPEAGSYCVYSSTSPSSSPPAVVGGSSGSEAPPRCLRLGERNLHPFALRGLPSSLGRRLPARSGGLCSFRTWPRCVDTSDPAPHHLDSRVGIVIL